MIKFFLVYSHSLFENSHQFVSKTPTRTMKFLILSFIALLGLSEYVGSVTLHCEFGDDYFGYKCDVKSFKITSKDDQTITEITGDHTSGRNHSDVKYFHSQQNTVKFFPLKLADFFMNLDHVLIYTATLSEIHSSDLKQFGGKLKGIWLDNNEVEYLEADLFQHNPNLIYITFWKNKIRHIDDGTFKNLEKLIQLTFHGGNPCIDKSASIRSQVIELISVAELKCKDFAYMQLKKYQEIMKVQLDEVNEKLSQQNAKNQEINLKFEQMEAKFLQCDCRMP